MNPYSNADLRSSIHHHRHHQSRHTSSSSPRPPIHRANFSDNSKAYSPQTLNHQHRHHQSNVHYPPPPAYQLSPSVTPRAPSPRPQLDFTSRPVDDDRTRRPLYHHHGHNHHHHHHHRLVDCEHRAAGGYESPYVENRSEFLDRREVLTDNHVKRPFSHVDADQDRHIHTVEHRSVSPFVPVDSFRHDSDSVSRVRVREDYTEGFESNHQHDNFTRGTYRRLASSTRSYDGRHELYDEAKFRKSNRRDHLTEKQWSYSGEGSAELGNSFQGMTYEARNGKEFETVPENKEYQGSESAGYNSGGRGGREGVREYNLTPRKQFQKKSAFLRLQLPKHNYRNRDNEHHQTSAHHDANELGSLKGKGQFANVDDGAKDRIEGGSVELDVSFKSNTLIAKAIVPPTSSRLDDQDLTPRNKKLKSAIVSDRESKSSSPDKVKDSMDKSNSSTDKLKETVKKPNSSLDKVKEIVDTSSSSSDKFKKIVDTSNSSLEKVKEIVDTANSSSDKVKEIAVTSNSFSDKVKEIVDTNNSAAIANSAISTSKDSREPDGKVVASAVEKIGSEGQGAKSVSHIGEDINSLASKETHINSPAIANSAISTSKDSREPDGKVVASAVDKVGSEGQGAKSVSHIGEDINSLASKETHINSPAFANSAISTSKDSAEPDGKVVASTVDKVGSEGHGAKSVSHIGEDINSLTSKETHIKHGANKLIRSNVCSVSDKGGLDDANSNKNKGPGLDANSNNNKDKATDKKVIGTTASGKIIISGKDGANTGCSQGKTLAEAGKKAGPGKNSSVKVKKKKIVKRLVKRVVRDKLTGQPVKKCAPTAIHASSETEKAAGTSEEKVVCKEEATLHDLVEKGGSTQCANLLPQIDKGQVALDLTSSPNDKGAKDGCSQPQSGLCGVLISSSAYDNSNVNIHCVSSSGEHPTALSAGTFVETSIEKSNCQLPQDLELSLPKKNLDGESCGKDQDIPSQLVLGESDFHKASDWVVSQARATVSEKECIDAVERKPCSLTSAVFSVASAQVSQKSFTCLASDISSSSTSEDSFSKNEAIDHRGQSCEMATMPKNGDGVSSVNVNSEEGLKKIVENAGKDGDRISQVGDLNSTKPHICVDDPIDISFCNPPKSVDQTIELSIRGPDPPAEVLLGGAAGVRPVHSVCDRSGSSNESSEADGSDRGDFLTSPSTLKRRKVSSPRMEFPSVGTSQNNDMALVTDKLSYFTERQLTSHGCEIDSEEGLAISSMHTSTSTVRSLSRRQDSCISPEDRQIAAFSNAVPGSLVQDCQSRGIGCNLEFRESDIASVESLNQLFSESQLEKGHPVLNPAYDDQKGVPRSEGSEELKVNVHPSEDTAIMEVEKPQASTEEPHICDRNLLSTMADDAGFQSKEESPSVSTLLSLSASEGGICTSNFDNAVAQHVPGSLSEMGIPESLSILLDTQTSSCKATFNQLCSKGVGENENKGIENPLVKELSISSHAALTSVLPKTKAGKSSNHSMEISGKETNKSAVLSSSNSKKIKGSSNPMSAELYGRRNQQGRGVRQIVPGHSSSLSGASKANSANPTSKSNTWRRPGNPSASDSVNKPFLGTAMGKQQFSRDPDKLQKTSYVPKGNSWVRNTSGVAAQPPPLHGSSQPVCRLKSPDLHDSKKSTGPGNGDDGGNLLNQARAGIIITTSVRPQTPPISSSSNSQSDIVFSACSPSPQAVELAVTSFGNPTSDPIECDNVLKSSKDGLKLLNTDLDQAVPPTGLLSRNEADDENAVNSNVKKITYVKPKSNQLVASVNDPELPTQTVDKTQTLGRDGYYKSKKNQLIRTSADGVKQPTVFGLEARVSTSQTCGSKKSQKAAARASKRSKSSLVWTLHSSLLSKSNSDAIDHPKAFPHLFPWKRPTYWRNLVLRRNRDKSSSAISSRLVHLRRRDAVYVRSSHGLSLRKAKVVSVGGSNLKWSKSIERRSKKANEEATRAFAAADKEKRENTGSSSVGSGTKNKNHSLRERIFRIGSFRYKMDPSRRTLLRISDESSGSAASQPGTVEKKSYVPRRLVIGNEEYVRIGNGNKLIRDPKKLTRVLASEKVRWSLHTARQRLAKKQKYCQFFTRFGKCTKGDGKCPYIHDPSKVAVCTKFLTGSCFNKDCKLTHKVIPERMPDCSYFLQGLCTNRKCPYRHVNVNPRSTTCEGFLRGYCADGDECRKKHTYVCPSFEATGSCAQGSKCKLHHPKPRSKKGKKRKRSATAEEEEEKKKKKKNSSSGRYFGGSKRVSPSEPGKTITGVTGSSFDEDDEGELGDYISLPDVSDEERRDDKMDEDVEAASVMDDDDSVDMWRFSDLDELIKPIKIMKV